MQLSIPPLSWLSRQPLNDTCHQNPPGTAEAYEQDGDDYFSNGQFSKYVEEEYSDPTDPVHPSNLSAALFEAGDYTACVAAILRAWALLRGCIDEDALVTKLSTRLAKALCLGVCAKKVSLAEVQHKEAIEALRKITVQRALRIRGPTANEELLRAWYDWVLVEKEATTSTGPRRSQCQDDFARMPHFSQQLDEALQYCTIGMNRIIDLTQGWSPHEEPCPLDVDKISSENLSKLSFLFGGVGDGRHALGTLMGLFQGYKRLARARQSAFHAHLTLLDIQPAMVARNLCTLKLLHNESTNSVARVEIKATLMYTFLAVVMPSYCYDRFMNLARNLRERLSETPPSLPPWLHLDADSIPAVKRALEYWLNTRKDTRRVLSQHAHISSFGQQGTGPRLGSGDELSQEESCDSFFERSRMYETKLRTLPVSTPIGLPHMGRGLSEREAARSLTPI